VFPHPFAAVTSAPANGLRERGTPLRDQVVGPRGEAEGWRAPESRLGGPGSAER